MRPVPSRRPDRARSPAPFPNRGAPTSPEGPPHFQGSAMTLFSLNPGSLAPGPPGLLLLAGLAVAGCTAETGETGTADTGFGDTGDPDTDDPDTDDSGDPDTGDPAWASGGSGGETGEGTATVGICAYAWLVPDCAVEQGPSAVVFSQHGSGGEGQMMIDGWRETAEAECFIVVGQDSQSSVSWNTGTDLDCFWDIAAEIESLYDVDTRRRYLDGHSAGGHWTWMIGLTYSDWFGGLSPTSASMSYAEYYGVWPEGTGRAIPVHIAHGTADTIVPYSEAEYAYEQLSNAGWTVELYTVEGGDHFSLPGYQEAAWAFLEENVPL